jgi:hypothetical protein
VPAILWLGALAAALDPVLPMAAAGCVGLARYPCLYLYWVAELGAWIDAQVRWCLQGALPYRSPPRRRSRGHQPGTAAR